MMLDHFLSTEQMTAVLDNAPIAIFVSELGNRRLLYANRLAQEAFLPRTKDMAFCCYHMAGFESPCPFCHTGEMSCSEPLAREYHHPLNGRIYQLSGKLIDWAGKPAHIEYVLDITKRRQEEEQTKALKEELQATFSSIPCGLCVYRFEKERIRPLFHNPAFYTLMGYSEEHIRSIEQTTTFLGVHAGDVEFLRKAVWEAVRQNGSILQTYRIWNDREGAYRWIRLEGAVKPQEDGSKLLYGVYSDVHEQIRLEKELTAAKDKMQDIVNAIPGGVAVYKVSDIFETVYFSDGVPQLTGYTVEEYRELVKRDAAEMIYEDDAAMVVGNLRRALRQHTVADFEFRKKHRDGHIVWVHIQAKQVGEEDGAPLMQCVFHNISALREAQSEMDHLVNSIPGGIASYRVENDRLLPDFYSDGVMALSGHSREEFDRLVKDDALSILYEPDRERVLAAAKAAMTSGDVLDISYRVRRRDGSLIWIHLNGRRMGPLAEHMKFYAVFTGMSAETRLFQSIANESADGIYVIDRQNYDLLYINESRRLFTGEKVCLGQKCYAALHGKSAPCAFCTLNSHEPDGEEHEMAVDSTERFYTTRFRETDWNGVPAYIKYVRDVTEEVETRREKERLEQYFQTLVKNLPGGVAVVRYEQDGTMTPEFLSDGFAALTGMTMEEAWNLYRRDAMMGVHPEDREHVREQMNAYIASGAGHCEIVYRLKKGNDSYIWVKNTLSLIQNAGGGNRVYAVYQDMTKELEEKERIRQQYNDLIVQHYRTPGPNALIVGHCNITQNRIQEILDYTHFDLLKTFGPVREEFFTGISGLIVDREERQIFLDSYLKEPAMRAFQRGDTERIMKCFIQLPQEPRGRYVQIQMNMVATPDSNDITGILTVTDITEQTIAERVLRQLSVNGYDFVADVDLVRDRYHILSCNENASCIPPRHGCHTKWLDKMLHSRIVPKDRERYRLSLDPEQMPKRLQKDGPYTFSFSLQDDNGDIRTKNMTVSAIDLRLGRVCLSRADITDSLREQQGLLNMIAYTFELAGLIDIATGRMTMYTRQMVLENLEPYIAEEYDSALEKFAERYGAEDERTDVQRQFRLQTMLERLSDSPTGYDFVSLYRAETGQRYKQINVLWGDENHKTVCLVQADVTDMLTSERESQKALENALAMAEKASQAKSDFLSAMSHDIRTPMNAIMGMTALALTHMGDGRRVEDYLKKIAVSSKHLLSLINDILDMSKIERSKISLGHMEIFLPELLDQLAAMMEPQAKAAGLQLNMRAEGIRHENFCGDPLRIQQILINIMSNAVKFTPEGGFVDFLVEEMTPVQEDRICYRFTIRDTGIGMSEEFLSQIFEPFTRSLNAGSIEGTGLGLSITKGLVDLMGGRIWVESKVHEGSVFRVELECETGKDGIDNRAFPDREPADEASLSTLFANRRFLVAEDNAINAEILCGFLDMYGAQYVVKSDGAQAVEAFLHASEGTFDAILMDIQMPHMNGYEATRTIRQSNRADAKVLPIVAMTANAFAEDVQASLEAGMTAHVAKPIDMAVLRNTLQNVLDNHSS